MRPYLSECEVAFAAAGQSASPEVEGRIATIRSLAPGSEQSTGVGWPPSTLAHTPTVGATDVDVGRDRHRPSTSVTAITAPTTPSACGRRYVGRPTGSGVVRGVATVRTPGERGSSSVWRFRLTW